jgi:hypothetical protein
VGADVFINTHSCVCTNLCLSADESAHSPVCGMIDKSCEKTHFAGIHFKADVSINVLGSVGLSDVLKIKINCGIKEKVTEKSLLLLQCSRWRFMSLEMS